MDLPDVVEPSSHGGDDRIWLMGQLLQIDEVTNRAQVSIDGGAAVWLPFMANVYTDITTVFILRDPKSGQMVMGPCGAQPIEEVPPAPPPPPPAVDNTPTYRTSVATIRPTYSGTYREIRSAWDRWNTDRYGGRSTLYQGDSFGSGDLDGFAAYGNQVANLGAVSISEIRVAIHIATGGGVVQVQGSPSGSRPAGAPSSSGAGASRTGSGYLYLPSGLREDFRTGAVKGLKLIGSNYLGVYGTTKSDGMALRVTYKRRA